MKIRKSIISFVCACAMVAGPLAFGAEAQSSCTYATTASCSSSSTMTGLGSTFANQGGPSSASIPDTVATPAPAADADATDTEAPQLAFTGSESEVLTAAGAGLIATGAFVLIARRRLSDD